MANKKVVIDTDEFGTAVCSKCGRVFSFDPEDSTKVLICPTCHSTT